MPPIGVCSRLHTKTLRHASGRGVRDRRRLVRNDDYPASLELRKLYPVLADAFATEHGLIRVIDESGEDYLYPGEFFVRVALPSSIEKTLAKIA